MKKTLAMLIALLMALAAVPTAWAENEVVEVTWMIENVSEGERKAYNEYMVAPFEAENPGIKINMIPTADNTQVLKVQMAAGEGPDLCNLDGPTVAQELQSAGRLRDLDPYFEQYGWSGILADWAEQTCIFDNKHYAIPRDVEAMWLWYNPDIFAENGWKVPTTHDELVQVCQAAMDSGLIAMSFGNGDVTSSIDHWLSTAYNLYAGVDDLKAALRGEKKWTDDTLKGSIQALNDLWQAGYINDRQSFAISGDDARALFYTGAAAMKMEGSWLYPILLSNAEINFDIALFPKLRDDAAYALPMGLGGAWGINANSSDKVADAAAKFLDFILTRTDLHVASIENAGLLPLPVDLPLDAFSQDADPRLITMISNLNDAQANLSNSGLVLWTFFPAELRSWQVDNMDKVFLGQMTVDAFCDGSQEVFDKCLKEGSVPPLP